MDVSQLADDGEAASASSTHTPDFDNTEPLEGEVLKPGEKSDEELRQEKEAKAEREAYTVETDPLKDVFYKGLCKASDKAAVIAGARVPMGEPIAGLTLTKRGAVGRAASDLVFDKLWKWEFLRAGLRKLKTAAKIMDEWGPIYVVLAEGFADTMQEVAERNKAYAEAQQQQQDRQPGAKAQQETDMMEMMRAMKAENDRLMAELQKMKAAA